MRFSNNHKLRFGVLLGAVLLLGVLAVDVLTHGDETTAPDAGILHKIVWSDDKLHLEGTVPAQQSLTVTLDDKPYPLTSNADGVFTLDAELRQRLPLRLSLESGGQVYDILIARWQRRWLVLQRLQGDTAWQPVMGYPRGISAGLAVLTQSGDAYGLTFYLPEGKPAPGPLYLYADRTLVQTQAATPGFFRTHLPATTRAIRLDVYDAAGTLQQRARVALPPGDAAGRYDLHDTDVWLFTELAAQKAEVDEFIPGQLVPVATQAAGAAPADKAAPPAQTPSAP